MQARKHEANGILTELNACLQTESWVRLENGRQMVEKTMTKNPELSVMKQGVLKSLEHDHDH